MRSLEFAEILENMMGEASLKNESFETKSPSQTLDPAYLSALMTITPLFKFKSVSADSRRAYAGKNNHQTLDPQGFKLKSAGMTAEQFKAYEQLFYALELPVLKAHLIFPEGFTLTQLKKAYKIAALKQHPDTGGSHESFLELKKSYELLREFVRTKPYAGPA